MSSSDTPKKIVLKSPYSRYDEAIGSGVITPGHLLARTSAARNDLGLDTVVKHATLGGAAERMFAIEDALQGNTIDDDYASGDVVRLHHALPGDEIYAFLSDGEDVAAGDNLESNGDGTLKKATGTNLETGHIAVAMEDVDLTTGTATADGRIRVRIL